MYESSRERKREKGKEERKKERKKKAERNPLEDFFSFFFCFSRLCARGKFEKGDLTSRLPCCEYPILFSANFTRCSPCSWILVFEI